MSTQPVDATATVLRTPMPMVSSGPCYVCGGTEWTRVWSDKFDLSDHPQFGPYAHAENPDTWLARCARCGFTQPEQLPGMGDYFDILYADHPWLTEARMREYYDQGTKDYVFRETLAEIGRALPPGVPKTLLDIGSYVGRFLKIASESGYQVEGAELNTRALDFSRRETGLTIHQVKAQDLAKDGRKFGIVTMIDVLEHIPKPAEIVASLRDLIEPGGLLVIKVPNGPMQRFKEAIRNRFHRGGGELPGVAVRFIHVNHFTAGSLRRLLVGAGYDSVRVTTAAPEFHLPATNPSFAQRRNAWGRIAAYRAARVVPGGVHSPLAMQLVAYATSPPAR